MQASADSFAHTPLGHAFVLRKPLAKATANLCANADCGCDIRAHARAEVTDEQLLNVLNAQDDGKASVILQGELSVGSYKAAMGACKSTDGNISVLNCAGTKLHDFMPLTRKDFDRLRSMQPPRLYDLEWEDAESFELHLSDIAAALAWAREQVAAGRTVLVNCAQGKSRSGAMAVAYLVAKLKVSVDEALARIRAVRPLVQPNPTFMKALRTFEVELKKLPAPASAVEMSLRRAFPTFDVDASGGLSLSELRGALVKSGESANEAKRMLDDFDMAKKGELSADEFVHAWQAAGCGAVPVAGS